MNGVAAGLSLIFGVWAMSWGTLAGYAFGAINFTCFLSNLYYWIK